MKQIDNRQKQQIQMRAQKAFLGGKNPAAQKEKEHGTVSSAPKEDTQPQTAENVTVRRNEPKVGRNDDCPCGSGKKYKKCCLKS